MEICIFYSWQNQYKDFCDRIIGKALEKAVKELKSESPNPTYTILRGGGGLIGSEDITDGINRALECTANIVVADYTNTGTKPRYNKTTNEWKKVRCAPNANTIYETSKAEARLGKKQIIKVYNKSYGDCDLNMDMPFDIILGDIELAISALGEISGMTVSDEIIDNIFENFCVGK